MNSVAEFHILDMAHGIYDGPGAAQCALEDKDGLVIMEKDGVYVVCNIGVAMQLWLMNYQQID